MATKQIQIYIYLIVFITSGIVGFPSRPLNERLTNEQTWQAWLLIDAQQQNQNENSGEYERRITPKSVFIAPKLDLNNGNSNNNAGNGPDGSNGNGTVALPECADGYRSDPMGHCIKFVKVDEAAHLDFLLQQLNALYGVRTEENNHDNDDGDVEMKTTAGPFQFNIPIQLDPDPVPDSNPERTQDEIPTSTLIPTTTHINSEALFFLTDQPEEMGTEDDYYVDVEEEQKEEEVTATTTTMASTTTTTTPLSDPTMTTIVFDTQPQASQVKGKSDLETTTEPIGSDRVIGQLVTTTSPIGIIQVQIPFNASQTNVNGTAEDVKKATETPSKFPIEEIIRIPSVMNTSQQIFSDQIHRKEIKTPSGLPSVSIETIEIVPNKNVNKEIKITAQTEIPSELIEINSDPGIINIPQLNTKEIPTGLIETFENTPETIKGQQIRYPGLNTKEQIEIPSMMQQQIRFPGVNTKEILPESVDMFEETPGTIKRESIQFPKTDLPHEPKEQIKIPLEFQFPLSYTQQIHFPNVDKIETPLLPTRPHLTSSEIQALFRDYMNRKPTRQPEHYYNHRNRDRNEFWQRDSIQKGFVSRVPVKDPHVATFTFHTNNRNRNNGNVNQNNEQYYGIKRYGSDFVRKRKRNTFR